MEDSTNEGAARATLRDRPRRPRFLWGYVRVQAKRSAHCDEQNHLPTRRECTGHIEVGDEMWWQPKLAIARCSACEPDEAIAKADKFSIWFNAATQEELEDAYGPLDDEPVLLSQSERDQLWENNPSFFGVTWEADERWVEEESVEGDESNFLSNNHLLRRDEPNARNLTSRREVLARSSTTVLADLGPLIDFHVGRVGRVANRPSQFHREDLRSTVVMSLLKAIPKFGAAGPFGAYANAVIVNCIRDYVRRERRMTERDVELLEGRGGAVDPTEAWCEWIDLLDGLAAVLNGKLLWLNALGYLDREIGKPGTVAKQRERAGMKLAQLLAA
jgi:hypothetical protein